MLEDLSQQLKVQHWIPAEPVLSVTGKETLTLVDTVMLTGAQSWMMQHQDTVSVWLTEKPVAASTCEAEATQAGFYVSQWLRSSVGVDMLLYRPLRRTKVQSKSPVCPHRCQHVVSSGLLSASRLTSESLFLKNTVCVTSSVSWSSQIWMVSVSTEEVREYHWGVDQVWVTCGGTALNSPQVSRPAQSGSRYLVLFQMCWHHQQQQQHSCVIRWISVIDPTHSKYKDQDLWE